MEGFSEYNFQITFHTFTVELFPVKKIVLLSDTHGYIDQKIKDYVAKADEVWHAGDIGKIDVLEKLSSIAKVRSVYGNIDNQIIRSCTDKTINFICEKLKVSITHIAGKPPNYNPYVRSLIKKENPNIFICGHSHILRVEFDKKNHFLFINPGAAGRHGFHKKRTMLRFEINGDQIKNMEIIELGNRSKLS